MAPAPVLMLRRSRQSRRRTRPILARLLDLWDRLRTSYWFVPAVMMLCAVGLALGLIRLDVFLISAGKDELPWFGAMEAEAARRILATTASTMVTVAGVVFSITVVVLQLTSSQFGPRLLRNFVADLTNQLILGTFVSAFVYCLLVLATIRNAPAGFVPLVATAVGLLFGVAGIGVLVFFIHHIAQAIRVETVVSTVFTELLESVDRVFPERATANAAAEQAGQPLSMDGALPVPAGVSGYVRSIDRRALVRIASARDLLIVLERRPGDPVIAGNALGYCRSGRPADAAATAAVAASIVVGPDRTPVQDIGYVLRQLAEIAVRALSPGINDPFTAADCIDAIAAGLHRAASRHRSPSHHFDEGGSLRLVLPPFDLCVAARIAVDPIARAALENAGITAHLLRAIGLIGEGARHAADRQGLAHLARALEQDCRSVSMRDRAELAGAYAECMARLGDASL